MPYACILLLAKNLSSYTLSLKWSMHAIARSDPEFSVLMRLYYIKACCNWLVMAPFHIIILCIRMKVLSLAIGG